MKIKALMKKGIKSQKIESMTNDIYKTKCATTLKTKLKQINKAYCVSLNETREFIRNNNL